MTETESIPLKSSPCHSASTSNSRTCSHPTSQVHSIVPLNSSSSPNSSYPTQRSLSSSFPTTCGLICKIFLLALFITVVSRLVLINTNKSNNCRIRNDTYALYIPLCTGTRNTLRSVNRFTTPWRIPHFVDGTENPIPKFQTNHHDHYHHQVRLLYSPLHDQAGDGLGHTYIRVFAAEYGSAVRLGAIYVHRLVQYGSLDKNEVNDVFNLVDINEKRTWNNTINMNTLRTFLCDDNNVAVTKTCHPCFNISRKIGRARVSEKWKVVEIPRSLSYDWSVHDEFLSMEKRKNEKRKTFLYML